MATPPNKKHAEPILVLALRRKLPEVANLLIDNGADPNATSRDNESAIYLALKAGRNDVAKNLLDHGADPNLLNCDYEDYTNFQFACLISRSDEELMQKFLDHGADINANTKSGVTLLDEATLCGPQDLIQFLIDHGANVNAKNNVNGEAPILDAARNGYTGVVKFLLDSGADIEATTSSGETPLILAIENSYLDTAKYLVARGANINAVASNNEIIQMFYEKDTGRWPTQQGISYGSVRPLAKTRMQPKEWIKAHYEGLLNGKPVDNKDLVFGKTTLAIAIDKAIEYEFDNNTVYSCRDYYDFARSLIESGANVNVLAIDGNPLIM
jgi:ankyrin repeat protein